jgi:hypothetical protein
LAITIGVRDIERSNGEGKASRIQRMHKSLENARRLLSFTAYLFGFCIFLQMATAFNLISTRSHLVAMSFADTLLLVSAFATDVFFVLLLLQALQWYASARLDRKM